MLPNTEGFKGASQCIVIPMKKLICTGRLCVLITLLLQIVQGHYHLQRRTVSMKVSSEKTIQQWYLYKPGTSYIKVKMRENDRFHSHAFFILK